MITAQNADQIAKRCRDEGFVPTAHALNIAPRRLWLAFKHAGFSNPEYFNLRFKPANIRDLVATPELTQNLLVTVRRMGLDNCAWHMGVDPVALRRKLYAMGYSKEQVKRRHDYDNPHI
jgi:hypothetical protein